MGVIEKGDVRKLLQDPELVTEITNAIIEDPEAMDDLADDIADKLSDELEEDPELMRKVVEAAMASPEFKKRVIKELVEDLG
ncbi:hypothetical protein ES703_33560 [subsurface metagenome]